MGDMIMLTPIIREYRMRNPNEFIGVETHCTNVFQNSPYVDQVAKIINRPTERRIMLDGAYEKEFHRHPRDVYAEHVIGTSDFEGKYIELFPTEKDRIQVDMWWEQFIGNAGSVAVCHYGLTWVKLRTQMLDDLMTHFLGKFDKVILIGQPIAAEYYPKKIKGFVDLVGSNWSIQKLHWLIQKADLYFGADTGIMHVAGTTSTPIVACFSFVDPRCREPYRPGVPFVPVYAEACDTPLCAASKKRTIKGGDFGGPLCTDFKCAKAITTEMVMDSIDEAMEGFYEQQKQDEDPEKEEEGRG